MRTRLCTVALVFLFATQLSAAEVLLKNSWISTFKNRVTMALTSTWATVPAANSRNGFSSSSRAKREFLS